MFKRCIQAMLLIALLAFFGAKPSWASVQWLASDSAVQQETPDDFSIQAAGMVTTDNALRYTVYIPKPLVDAESYVVQVDVPSDATINQVLHGGESTFAGIFAEADSSQQLVWTITAGPSGDDATLLSFVLAKPIDKPLVVTANWDGATLQKEVVPRYAYNFSNVGQVVLGGEQSAEFQRVGVTGILIRAASGSAGGESTIITARALPPEDNPPAETGDYWWCSVLELSEIADGETVIVQMPLRRPLPPGTPVVLFQRQADGSWLPLENPGVVTADGQAVEYEHPGGVIATGVEASLQPKFAELTTLTRQALDELLVGNQAVPEGVQVTAQSYTELPPDIQIAFSNAENLNSTPEGFAAANAANAYAGNCGVAANGESVCAYWVEVGLCTISVNALPNLEAVPTVICSNSPPPEGYNSACLMGEGAC
ncbi:MAG: hypothetical protein BroJett018_47480 [Chloroflexota bacterium]|nr:MAG: hypothetical protein BroJett018_47480 [Chloroflexota bacterium]